jgi:putative SOS response-associated peptidase YedK
MASRAPMGLGALYETWSDPFGGEIDTACLVTTRANGMIGTIHDRMAAIIQPADHAAWLDNDGVEPGAAMRLLRPAPEEALEMVEISRRVNRVGEYGPEVWEPLNGSPEDTLDDCS